MTNEKNWRDAKIPQWVRESIENDMREGQLKAALAWPTEAEPTPVPFSWGGYDILTGEPVEGVYYDDRYAEEVHIRKARPEDRTSEHRMWKKWVFSRDGLVFDRQVVRGALYNTKREALLAILWRECREAANGLHDVRQKLEQAEREAIK